MVSQESVYNDTDEAWVVWWQHCKEVSPPKKEKVIQPGEKLKKKFKISETRVHEVCVLPMDVNKVRDTSCKETVVGVEKDSVVNVSDIIAQGRQPLGDEPKQPSGETEAYTWTQTDDEVEIVFKNEGLQKSDKKLVNLIFHRMTIKVDVKGETLLQGNFSHAIDPHSSTWTLADGALQVIMPKEKEGETWERLLLKEDVKEPKKLLPQKRKADADAERQEDAKVVAMEIDNGIHVPPASPPQDFSFRFNAERQEDVKVVAMEIDNGIRIPPASPPQDFSFRYNGASKYFPKPTDASAPSKLLDLETQAKRVEYATPGLLALASFVLVLTGLKKLLTFRKRMQDLGMGDPLTHM